VIETKDYGRSRLRIRFGELPAKLQKRVKAEITSITREILGRVKAAEPVRTGRLRRQTVSFIDEKPNWVRGRVRIWDARTHSTAAAGGALEYGAHRRFEVRSHSAKRTQAFGKPIKRTKVTIPAYQRRANIQAMRFMRGPAAALMPRARERLREVIGDEIREKGT
jgi:hypothetical protein